MPSHCRVLSPEHLVPDATPVSSQRLQAPTGHHPLVLNYAIGHSSSAQCATNSRLQLSAILRKPFPGQPAAASNPHRQPSSHRCPAGSFFGGFPTPASLPGSTLTPGRHPKPFTNLAVRFQSRERPELVIPADRWTSREGLDFDASTAVDQAEASCTSNPTPSREMSLMSAF